MAIDHTWTIGHTSAAELIAAQQKTSGTTSSARVSETVKTAIDKSDLSDEFKTYLNEETSKLLAGESSDIASINKITSAALSAAGDTASSQTSSDSEVKLLIDSLDKSILGAVTSSLDMDEVASDLLSGAGSDRVIDQLVSGHLNSIVMSSSDLDNDSNTVNDANERSITSSLTDPTTETLAQNLETILAKLNV